MAYDYDNLGPVTQVTGPDGNSVWFWYDANGNMTVLTTPHAVDHEFAVNEVDSPESYLTPLSGAYTYTYDPRRVPPREPNDEFFSYRFHRVGQIHLRHYPT